MSLVYSYFLVSCDDTDTVTNLCTAVEAKYIVYWYIVMHNRSSSKCFLSMSVTFCMDLLAADNETLHCKYYGFHIKHLYSIQVLNVLSSVLC